MIATRFDTERLALLPLRVEYAEEMAKVLASPSLYTFIGGEPPAPEAVTSRYRRQLAGPDHPGEYWLNWVISSLHDDALVGYIQATVQATVQAAAHETAPTVGEGTGTASTTEAEIAWVVGADWQGRGYAREAAKGLVSWLRGQGTTRITAHIHPDHAASAAVAQAIGLHRTDHLDDGEYLWELR